MKTLQNRHEFLSDIEMVPHKMTPINVKVTPPKDFDGEAYMVGSEVTYIQKNTPARQKQDLLNSKLLAQLAANKEADKLSDAETWYKKYIEVLENIGYAINDFQFVDSSKSSLQLRVDKELIELIGAILTGNEIIGLKAAMDSLKSLEDENGKITLFNQNVTDEKGGKFQISAGKINADGNLVVSMGAYYTHKHDDRGNFLWFNWGQLKIEIFAASQVMELDEEIYSSLRDKVIEKLGDHAQSFIHELNI